MNTNAGDFLGHKTYANILDREPVELAMFGIPFRAVIPVLKDCGQIDIKPAQENLERRHIIRALGT